MQPRRGWLPGSGRSRLTGVTIAAGAFTVAAATALALAGYRANPTAATVTNRPPTSVTAGSATAAIPSAAATPTPTPSPKPGPTPVASPFADCASPVSNEAAST